MQPIAVLAARRPTILAGQHDKEETVTQIIFVGGDSRQERTARQLAHKGALQGLDVVFYHPDWTSNWGRFVERVKRQLGPTSFLVLTQDVPTELGHALRQLARDRRVPWRGVKARGQTAVLRALREAAKAAQ